MGNTDQRAERAMPRLPRRRPAYLLGRLAASAQPDRVQRLPQSDGAIVAQRPVAHGVGLRYLHAVPPTAASGISAPLAHAASRREDELRRLSQPARLGDAP